MRYGTQLDSWDEMRIAKSSLNKQFSKAAINYSHNYAIYLKATAAALVIWKSYTILS